MNDDLIHLIINAMVAEDDTISSTYWDRAIALSNELGEMDLDVNVKEACRLLGKR